MHDPSRKDKLGLTLTGKGTYGLFAKDYSAQIPSHLLFGGLFLSTNKEVSLLNIF